MLRPDHSLLIFGHTGLLGHSLCAICSRHSLEFNIADRNEYDLRNRSDVDRAIDKFQPDVVINAAGVVGGIGDNLKFPAKYLYDNLLIQANVLDSVAHSSVKQYLTYGSSCMYPRDSKIPYNVQDLYSGSPEISNLPYALAKLSTVELVRSYNRQYGKNFISLIPTNIYGPHDKFHSDKSHVIPALISKMHDAKNQHKSSITLWGSGSPLREFLFVDDLSSATFKLLGTEKVPNTPINVGSSSEISIVQLASLVAKVVEYEGSLDFDSSKPDGSARKLLDSSYLRSLGWKPTTSLSEGLAKTYTYFLSTLH
jgi:GDP-L-fucose synthase